VSIDDCRSHNSQQCLPGPAAARLDLRTVRAITRQAVGLGIRHSVALDGRVRFRRCASDYAHGSAQPAGACPAVVVVRWRISGPAREGVEAERARVVGGGGAGPMTDGAATRAHWRSGDRRAREQTTQQMSDICCPGHLPPGTCP